MLRNTSFAFILIVSGSQITTPGSGGIALELPLQKLSCFNPCRLQRPAHRFASLQPSLHPQRRLQEENFTIEFLV
jgi:hypothetical protein